MAAQNKTPGLLKEALGRFEKLLAKARKTSLPEPAAAALATADARGRPSLRTVLVKEFNENGFVFYTHLGSRKARDLRMNAKAALCFYWQPFDEQAVIEGAVRRVPDKEADAYWVTRPLESQLGAWASLQSRPLQNRTVLLARATQAAARFAGRKIPRPEAWSGFRVVPRRIEFLSRRSWRLHERILYEKRGNKWSRRLLYP